MTGYTGPGTLIENIGLTNWIKISVVVTKVSLCTINFTVWWQRQLYNEGYLWVNRYYNMSDWGCLHLANTTLLTYTVLQHLQENKKIFFCNLTFTAVKTFIKYLGFTCLIMPGSAPKYENTKHFNSVIKGLKIHIKMGKTMHSWSL